MWKVTGGSEENELIIESTITNSARNFMSAPTLTKHRGNAKRVGGPVCADACMVYHATFELGQAIDEHRPDAKVWLNNHAPWGAEPLYDSNKRGQVIVPGKVRLILRNKDEAILFKVTFA